MSEENLNSIISCVNRELNKEEISDVIFCLKHRREGLINSIRLFNELIRDNKGRRLEIIENCTLGYKNEIDKLDLIILKLQNLL